MKKLIDFLQNFFLIISGICFCISMLGLITEGLLELSGVYRMLSPWSGWAIILLISVWSVVLYALTLAWDYFYGRKS